MQVLSQNLLEILMGCLMIWKMCRDLHLTFLLLLNPLMGHPILILLPLFVYRLCTTFWDDTTTLDVHLQTHKDDPISEIEQSSPAESEAQPSISNQTPNQMFGGDILEDLKSQSQVSSNGGLIVTFILVRKLPLDTV